MKEVKSIQTEIDSLLEELKHAEKDKPLFKRLQFLKVCKMYLETNPSEDFIKKEKSRLSKRIQLLRDGYSGYKAKDPDPKKWKSEYNKATGLNQLNVQLRTINFLLN